MLVLEILIRGRPKFWHLKSLETHGEWEIILKLFILFNYKANVVGCNQMCSTFMPNLEAWLHNTQFMFTRCHN
jgi:hypothetical protein